MKINNYEENSRKVCWVQLNLDESQLLIDPYEINIFKSDYRRGLGCGLRGHMQL